MNLNPTFLFITLGALREYVEIKVGILESNEKGHTPTK